MTFKHWNEINFDFVWFDSINNQFWNVLTVLLFPPPKQNAIQVIPKPLQVFNVHRDLLSTTSHKNLFWWHHELHKIILIRNDDDDEGKEKRHLLISFIKWPRPHTLSS